MPVFKPIQNTELVFRYLLFNTFKKYFAESPIIQVAKHIGFLPNHILSSEEKKALKSVIFVCLKTNKNLYLFF